MYRPKCAAKSDKATKYCRDCGTNLESVILALEGRPMLPAKQDMKGERESEINEAWRKERRKSVRDIAYGATLLGVALPLGIGSLLIYQQIADLFAVWVIVFGALACWGTISLAMGISRIVESKVVPQLDSASMTESTPSLTTGEILSLSPPSVTEHTTAQLSRQTIHTEQSAE